MNDNELKEILEKAKTIAIVGLSDNPDRESYGVASYLLDHGYHIIPVNPYVGEVLGRRSYPSLRLIPDAIDIVDVFRRPDAVPSVVEDAIAMGAKVVWMQLGVVNEEAAERARRAGLKVIMNRCTKQEHARLFGTPR